MDWRVCRSWSAVTCLGGGGVGWGGVAVVVVVKGRWQQNWGEKLTTDKTRVLNPIPIEKEKKKNRFLHKDSKSKQSDIFPYTYSSAILSPPAIPMLSDFLFVLPNGVSVHLLIDCEIVHLCIFWVVYVFWFCQLLLWCVELRHDLVCVLKIIVIHSLAVLGFGSALSSYWVVESRLLCGDTSLGFRVGAVARGRNDAEMRRKQLGVEGGGRAV